jgi:hypothetical protein
VIDRGICLPEGFVRVCFHMWYLEDVFQRWLGEIRQFDLLNAISIKKKKNYESYHITMP